MIRSPGRKTAREAPRIACLFLDIGGVLLTDGWNGDARKDAARHFKLDLDALEARHHQIWDAHQEGKVTLNDYLSHAVFHEKRAFTRGEFRRFMLAQSRPYPEMIALVAGLKRRHRLKIAVVSNEGRELNAYRIRRFKLDGFVDTFVSSCFVHLLKPDPDMFRLALDVAQAPADKVVYIENTPMFVEVAQGLGIRSILHADPRSTRARLAALGLESEEAKKDKPER